MLFVSESRQKQGIHVNKVPIALDSCEPTRLDPKEITRELNEIGLYCDETRGEKLEKNIKEVTEKIGIGKLATFGVYKENNELKMEPVSADKIIKLRKNHIGTLNELLEERFQKEAEGSWTEGTVGQFTSKLQVLQNRDNFDFLKEKALDFPYAEDPTHTTSNMVSTVEAIKDMFTKAALSCTAATVEGLDQTSLEAVFSNAMDAINTSVFQQDYDASNNRVISLLLNYDPNTSDCDGVGIVTCEWRLQVRNYKEKKADPRHETILTIGSRSVLYTDVETLDKHYGMCLAKNTAANCLFDDAIHIIQEVEVFEKLPPATMQTFVKSLPCESDTEHMDVMVFYSPDVQKVGFLDNTLSAAAATYTKSITSGFVTQSTVGFSMELNYEINAEVAKMGAKFGFNVSMTDQWSKSQTETISFQVPAGKRAFLYQITILCAKLRLDCKTGKYSYIKYDKFLTDAYKTTNEPLYENKQ